MPKILVIDDRKDNLISITALMKLCQPDCKAITALSGEQGIKLARSENPDTILLDINMPKMDGFEVCRRLKKDEELKHIPIIFLTAVKTSPQDRIKGLRLGGDAYLTKPIEEGELIAHLGAMLRIKGAEDELRREKKSLEQKVFERTKDLESVITDLKKSEEALREGEERFRSVVESASDGIIICEQSGNITLWNNSAQNMFGYRADEIIGKQIIEIIPETYRRRHQMGMQRLAKTGKKKFLEKTLELEGLRKDGSVFSLEISFSTWHTQEMRFISAIARDITERKRAEEKLSKINRLFATLSQINQAIVRELDKQKLFQEICNIAIEFGKFRLAWIGFVDEENKSVIPAAFSGEGSDYLQNTKISLTDDVAANGHFGRSIRAGKSVVFDDLENNPDFASWREQALEKGYRSSGAFPIQVNNVVTGVLSVYAVEPHFFDKDEINLLDEVARDISFALEKFEEEEKRQQAEEALRAAEIRSRTLLEGSPVCNKIIDLDSRLQYMSAAGIEQLKIPDIKPFYGCPYPPDFFPESTRTALTEHLECAKAGEVSSLECRALDLEGGVLWYHTTFVPARDDAGQILYIIATSVNITERKQAESIKDVLCEISDAMSVSNNLEQLLAIIRQKISVLIDTTNFYVALYDSKDEVYSFPYCSDAYDEPAEFSQQLLRKSLTEYVRRTGRPLFVNKEMHQELIRQGKVEMVGTPCTQWLGVPLKTADSVFGVVVVQNYKEPALYSEKDLALMTFVAEQIALAIERKQAEEELRGNEERFRSLFSSASDGIIISDQSGNIALWNNGAENMFGYRADEIIGKQVTEIMPGYHRPRHEEGMWRLNKAGIEKHNGKTLELEGLRKDGSVFPLEFSIATWQTEGKRFFSAITRDITRRKQAEEELKTLSTAIEQSPAVVIITDPKGNIEYVNPKFCELTGYSAEEVLGKNPRILQGGEVPKQVYEKLWKTILSGNVWHGEFHNRKKNGELYWENTTIAAIYDDNGKITHFIGLKEGITERKQMEEEKAKLEEQLRRSQKLETIGTLAGGIAHDFNNILTPIVGYADMALSELPSSNPLHEDLQHILNGAIRAKDLVEQILLFSRQVEKERKPFSLHIIVKEALKLLRPSIPTTVEIRQRIDASCDKVLADATQMHQVIVNLCTNAWQSMAEKGGTLTIELNQVEVDAATAKLYANLNEQDYVRLSVSDTGTGMDDKTLERIFEPFFTTKEVKKGTGMGLSVVHGIVRSHHGDVLVDSEPGKGSTFHVYLPVVRSEEEISKEEPLAIQGGQESILVVDDEETVANVVKRLLERLGYEVDVFNNSLEALKVIRQQPDKYDVVISDLTMPNMTGLDLSEKLQKLRPEFPAIIMTGYGDSLTSATQKQYGIKQVVRKPVVMRELASAIRVALDK